MRISDWSSDVCSSDLFWNCLHSTGPQSTLDHLSIVPDWDVALLVECTRPFVEAARRHYGDDRVRSALDHVELTQPKPTGASVVVGDRSEERRVGTECVSTCSSRWSPDHKKKNK